MVILAIFSNHHKKSDLKSQINNEEDEDYEHIEWEEVDRDTEQPFFITKRNGIVPMISSKLFLSEAKKESLKDLCLKYVPLFQDDYCPACSCSDYQENEKHTLNTDLKNRNTKRNQLYSLPEPDNEEPERDIIINSEDLKDEENKNSNFSDNYEEIINFIEDEFDIFNEVIYKCIAKKKDENDIPQNFNLVVNKDNIHKNNQNQYLKADRFTTFLTN